MPTYLHECLKCTEEFEDFYGINAPLPPCPKCGDEGEVRRLICGTNKGQVTLTGQDYTNKVKADTAQLKRDVRTNENLRANLIGENRYNQLTTKRR